MALSLILMREHMNRLFKLQGQGFVEKAGSQVLVVCGKPIKTEEMITHQILEEKSFLWHSA